MATSLWHSRFIYMSLDPENGGTGLVAIGIGRFAANFNLDGLWRS